MLHYYRIIFRLISLLVTTREITAGVACLSNPCTHGICIDDINSTYSCYCVDGYTGVQCQTNWNECWSDPCLNGGVCIDGIASYNCSCPEGFIGDNCEINYNECESNPCLNNGTCIDMTNGYVCSCVPGFSGHHCELDVAVCNATEEVRCHNGGHCIEGPGFKFYCKCIPGWGGPTCEAQIDECESNPCQNGAICIDVLADYLCACPFGFTGKSCEVKIEFCDTNSCSNNALCVIEDGFRVCYCVPDYHGERCELQYDECLLGPRCTNGGTCIDGVDNFTCSCPPMLTGPLCECLLLEDGSQDCTYVSPTPLTKSTQPVFLTTVTDQHTTVIDSTTINYTNISLGVVSTSELTTNPPVATTPNNSSSSEMTKPTSIDSTTSDENESTTSSNIPTSIATEISITTETFTSLTTIEIPSDNSKTDSTTSVQTSEKPTTATTPHENVSTLPATDIQQIPVTNTTVITVTDKGSETTVFYTNATTILETTTSHDLTTTTIVVDTTTGKMFTDTPTDHTTTESSRTSTESTEFTLSYDTTASYTTVQSECTESLCNNHGTCFNSLHGVQCHCSFNYGGKFCEDKLSITSAAFGGNSYIAHKLQNITSINIAFKAKTLKTDGQVIYVDLAKDVYMQLYMNGGLLKFKFSCGYQTMLLSELKTFVNKGYLMKIESKLDINLPKQYCNATLQLNDTLAMSGGQMANISSLDYDSTLYLGKNPNVTDLDIKPFVGCISDLIINNKKRDIFEEAFDAEEIAECLSLSCLSTPCMNAGSCNDLGDTYSCSCANGWMGEHCNNSICEHNPCHSGGSCVLHPGSGFLCLCPYGKHGIFCEYNVDITRPSIAPLSIGISSFLMYPLSSMAMNSDRFDLRLRFQTTDMDQIALLAFVGQKGHHDSRSPHLALTFVKGYIMLTWNMGNGPRRIFTSRPLSGRSGGHVVRAWRRGRAAGLTVDGRYNVSGNAPAHDSKMTLLPYIYIGGHPSLGFSDLPHDLPLHSGWKGCIWEVGGQAIGPGKAVGGRGVGQCGVAQCTAKSCNAPKGVCIHSPATYGCICNEGWFGATCSATRNPCDKTQSNCNGRCVITADSRAQCDCPYGKTGAKCDSDLEPTDVLFTGVRSYLRLFSHMVSSVSVSVEAELKPSKERGLVVYIETPHFHTSLSLQGGLVEYRWADRLSGVTSLVRSGIVLSMSQWHSVKAGRYGSRLYVWVDGNLSTEAMLAHAYPHTASNASVVLGGAEDLSSLPFDVMSGPPETFAGCLRKFNLNNILTTLERHNILDGQNLEDCDGTICGEEKCLGSSCIVVDGRAKCACAGRCRRHAPCATPLFNNPNSTNPGFQSVLSGNIANEGKATCSPPGGSCRRGVCVCSAGYSGPDCLDRINVTIPQFMGESLLAIKLNEHSNDHQNEQRLSQTVPSYFALNFTTAQLNGLLMWTDMDADYLGLGLENGFLKITLLFHKVINAYEFENKPKCLSKMLPNSGFLADGEWHTVTLKTHENNIILTVDKQTAFVEEPGLRADDYANVELYIGGISHNLKAKKVFPSNFKGCIDNISTKEQTFITNYAEVYSENIQSCQLYS